MHPKQLEQAPALKHERVERHEQRPRVGAAGDARAGREPNLAIPAAHGHGLELAEFDELGDGLLRARGLETEVVGEAAERAHAMRLGRDTYELAHRIRTLGLVLRRDGRRQHALGEVVDALELCVAAGRGDDTLVKEDLEGDLRAAP